MPATSCLLCRRQPSGGGGPPKQAQRACAQLAGSIDAGSCNTQAGDELPRSPAGILVAVADRLDSLVGLCAAGCAPTASADPFGLRRRCVPYP